jgi:outer membrane protein assembly factor BamB
VTVPNGRKELVLGASNKMQAFDPENGKLLWYAKVYDWYIDPSLVTDKGVVFGLQHSICVAVRAGGSGDVTKTHVLWKKNFGHVVSSPVVHNGYLFFTADTTTRCLDTASGKLLYQKPVNPRTGTVYASPIVVDGKIYFVSQDNGAYVLAEGPRFEQLAHNVFADDHSRTNASPIVSHGCLLLRTDRYLYCIGNK